MAVQGVAFALQAPKLQLVTITVPLAQSAIAPRSSAQEQDDLEVLPPRLPPEFAALSSALTSVRSAATPALPFCAHILGADQLRIVCQKSRVAEVFKLLRAQQAALGIEVKDVKRHVSLAAPAGEELAAAAAAGLAAVLQASGWWQMDEERLLGASPLQPSADGQGVAAASVSLKVHVAAPAGAKDQPRVQLLVMPEQVEWRHPACRPGAIIEERNARLAGTVCTLLPDLRPALVHKLRPADAATLARLRPLWAEHGQPLPAEAEQQPIVEVCLDCDPDAPSYPFPACRVLGQYGIQTGAAKPNSPAVHAVLAKLRDDLAASPFKVFGEGLCVGPTAHEWFPEGPPALRGRQLAAAAPAPETAGAVFVTARQHEVQSKGGQEEHGPALGAPIDVGALSLSGGGAGAAAGQQRQRRQYAPVDPQLQAAFAEAKRLQAEAERPAGAARAATQPSTAAPAVAPAPAKRLPPLALRQAAAAAAGGASQPAVPTFKKVGMAAAAGTASKKPAAAGQKRAAAAKGAAKPPAPKRPKAARAPDTAAPAAAATPKATSFAAGPYAGLPAATPAATPAGSAAPTPAKAVPGSAAKPPVPRPRLASTAAEGGGMGLAVAGAATSAAAAPPKAPPKPRAKAADIDVAAVTAKVQQMHAAGTLGKLTMPEMKAYLKSLKLPVGGKKGDLEERVRQSLGGGGAATPAPAGA